MMHCIYPLKNHYKNIKKYDEPLLELSKSNGSYPTSCGTIYFFWTHQFSSNLIIGNVISRPLGVMLFCAERRSRGFGGAEPPRVGESQGRAGQGTFQRRKKEKKKKRTWPASHPSRDPRACRNEILRSDPLTLINISALSSRRLHSGRAAARFDIGRGP